jgi:nicotinamide riboside kinase
MRISISGTHSSGKSTLIQKLSELEDFKNFKFIPGPTRTLKAQGFLINESGTDETQLMCMSVDIQNLFLNNDIDVISDRCLLDTYIYTLYLYGHGKVDIQTLNATKILWERYKTCYDLILMPSHFEVPLTDDGERSINLEFRDTVYRLFLEEVNSNIGILNCYMVGGTIEERINYIRQILVK